MARKLSEKRIGLKEQVKDLYNAGLLVAEICNMVGVSQPTISRLIGELVKLGELKQRENIRNKHIDGIYKKSKYLYQSKRSQEGYHNPKKKLSVEQEKQLLYDYFVLDMSANQVKQKYNVGQQTFINLTRQERAKYPPKKKGCKYADRRSN
jgi:DNA invertase Pin-like site-specific DNA recombinase